MLGQVFVLAPGTPFKDVSRALAQLGWARDGRETQLPPIVRGEPELAGWNRAGRLPRITSTYQPVVGMRVLEVATVPPDERARIAARLPPLEVEAVRALLSSADPRRRLYGAFAARELELTELAPPLREAARQGTGEARELVDAAAQALEQLGIARTKAMDTLRQVAITLAPLLAGLAGPEEDEVIAGLRPLPGDAALVFDPEIAAAVERAYAEAPPPVLRLGFSDPEARVVVCPAGMLRWPSPYARHFPVGYRTVAGWLQPSMLWAVFELRERGAADGTAFDGLVRLETRWAWYPGLVRTLGPLCLGR